MIKKLTKQFEDFFRSESSSSVLLLLFALLALVWSNSRLAPSYYQLLHLPITVGIGKFLLSRSLVDWVNEGLMAIFFLLVGLEIKRELVVGELKSLKKAALPIGAAFGGMLAPALIYIALNYGTKNAAGWAIPMATDIAFALGAIKLVGRGKVPAGLAVFLTALAIVDDLGAILVIAVFYTKQISWGALFAALIILLALLAVNKLRPNSLPPFIALGVLLWGAMLSSGVHATVAGLLLGMTIPVRQGQHQPTKSLLRRMEHALQPWVAYGIMPIFALTNAGVEINLKVIKEVLTSPVTLAIIAGLFFGKQLGIWGASYLMVHSGLGKLPANIRMSHIYLAGSFGGIGFTIAIFIATLAFSDTALLAAAKTSIIIASLASAAYAFLISRLNRNMTMT